MAIKVQWEADGPFAICDTSAEAIELLKQARSQSNGTTPKSRAEAPVIPQGVESKIDAFLTFVNDKGKSLLVTLLNNPAGMEGDNLSKAMDIDSHGLGGVMGSLSKSAGKAGLDITRLIVSEARFEGIRRYRWMMPGKLLLEHKGRIL